METEEERGHETVRTDVKNWPEDQEIGGEMVRADGTHRLLSHDGLWLNWKAGEGGQHLIYQSIRAQEFAG